MITSKWLAASGDAATEDMREAHGKIVRLALQTV
jgi:hypothetical protein